MQMYRVVTQTEMGNDTITVVYPRNNVNTYVCRTKLYYIYVCFLYNYCITIYYSAITLSLFVMQCNIVTSALTTCISYVHY